MQITASRGRVCGPSSPRGGGLARRQISTRAWACARSAARPSSRPRWPPRTWSRDLLACIWPHCEHRHGLGGVVKPAGEVPPIGGERGAQDGTVFGSPTAVCPAADQHHQRRGGGRRPPRVLPDPDRQTTPPVHRGDQVVDIDELRLELDDKEHRPVGVPSQHVDDAALAIDRIRHLGPERPRRKCLQVTSKRFVEQRMAPTEHPIDFPTTPARDEIDPQVDRRRQSPEHADRHTLEVTALEQRYGAARYPRGAAEIRLAPAAPPAQQPNRGTEPLIVHAGSLPAEAQPAVLATKPTGCSVSWRAGPARRGRRRHLSTPRPPRPPTRPHDRRRHPQTAPQGPLGGQEPQSAKYA